MWVTTVVRLATRQEYNTKVFPVHQVKTKERPANKILVYFWMGILYTEI